LRAAVSEALRRSAPSARPDPYEVAPLLMALGDELKHDTQVAKEDRLKFRAMFRLRLKSMAEKLEKEIQDQAEEAKKAARRPKTVVPPEPGADVLAQQPGPAFGPGGFGPGRMGPGFGGPGFGGPGFGGQAPGQAFDHGQELVDLIKRTIAPETWDDAGGLGTIYYYRPLHVLVIRQTGEIHERIGGAVGNLRRP
jgi:hypothetical protein